MFVPSLYLIDCFGVWIPGILALLWLKKKKLCFVMYFPHFSFPNWCDCIDLLDSYSTLVLVQQSVTLVFFKSFLFFFFFLINTLNVALFFWVCLNERGKLHCLHPKCTEAQLILTNMLPCVWFYSATVFYPMFCSDTGYCRSLFTIKATTCFLDLRYI